MIKNLLIFVGGLVVGAFGYEALMRDVHQQEIVGMITEGEIQRIEEFLKIKNASDEVRYCVLYSAARYNAQLLNQKIEAAESGKFHNGLLLSNMESVKRVIDQFASLEEEGLEYVCENT